MGWNQVAAYFHLERYRMGIKSQEKSVNSDFIEGKVCISIFIYYIKIKGTLLITNEK